MRHMKHKYAQAMQIYLIPDYEILLQKQRINLWRHILHLSHLSWPRLVLSWDPRDFDDEFLTSIGRRCGRPVTRWDDVYQSMGDQYFRNTKWYDLDIREFDLIFGTN